MDADISSVLDAAEDKDKVVINGTLMNSGSSYTFKLSKFISRPFVTGSRPCVTVESGNCFPSLSSCTIITWRLH